MDFFVCKNLVKEYGSHVIFDNVSISFPSKGLISIVGPSGCGKSTLINCLLGIETCKGEVFFQEHKIKNFEKFRNKYATIIFQSFNLFEFLTVEENITFFAKSKEFEKVVKLLKLEDKLSQEVRLLSGGEKQRVAIARSLMKDPLIIFCDEVTGSLDEENETIIMEYLKELSKKILIINISHNLLLVKKYSDDIIYFSKEINYRSISFLESKINRKISLISFLNSFKISGLLMKKSMFKIILSLISLVITFSILGIVINFSYSIDNYFSSFKNKTLDYSFLEVYKQSEIELENSSLTLIKQVRPLKEEIKLNENFEYGYNFSNLINSYTSLRNYKGSFNIEFLPCLSNEIESYNQVIVNQKAYEIINSDYFYYSLKRNIDYIDPSNKVVSDVLDLFFEIKVVSKTLENEFLQTPRIYYSYYLFEDYLDSLYLENLSIHLKRKISILERISNYSYEGDYYNTGSMYVILSKQNIIEEVYKIINNQNNEEYKLVCKSRGIDSYKTFETLFETILSAIEVFLVLNFIISLSLLGLCLNSLILDQEKEIAIMKSLGVISSQVNKMIFNQIIFVLSYGLLLSFLIKNIIYKVINIFFSFLKINNLSGILLENTVIFLLNMIICLILFCLSRMFIKKINIVKVLKED